MSGGGGGGPPSAQETWKLVQCRLPGDVEEVRLKVGYVGETKGGRQHGWGAQVYENGDVYRGEWRDGAIHGSGCYIYRNGASYCGQFCDNRFHGWGRWTPAGGSDDAGWEGEYVNGKRKAANPLQPPPRPQPDEPEAPDEISSTPGEPVVPEVGPDDDDVLSAAMLSQLCGHLVLGGAATAAAEAADRRRFVTTAGDVEKLHYNGGVRSCFCLQGDSPLRLKIFDLVTSPAFQRSIFVVILANTFFIAMDQDGPRDLDGMADTIDVMGYLFQSVYLLEAALKIAALGFVMHDFAYLKHPSNVVDFVVVVSGMTPYVPFWDVVFPSGVNGVALLRLLRPVRLIAFVSGMRIIVVALTRSWRGVLEVSQLLAMFLSLFAIAGVNMYAGLLNQACYYYEADANGTAVPRLVQNDTDVPCSTSSEYGRQCAANGFRPPHAGDARLPFSGEQVCEIHTDMHDSTPMNFDTVLKSALVVFRVISQDDWPWIVHQTQSAAGWWSGMTFHCLVVVFGTFFTINLFLAVLIEKYSETSLEAEEAKTERRMAQRERRHDISRRLARASNAGREDALMELRQESGKVRFALDRAKRRFLAALFAVFPGVPSLQPILDEKSFSGVVIDNTILVITVFNIVVMSVEYHGQSESMDTFVLVSNLVCGVIFVIEGYGKLFCMGARQYFFLDIVDGTGAELSLKKEPKEFEGQRTGSIFGGALEVDVQLNGFNCFDFFLVQTSLPEIAAGRGGFMQVFRIFRVFRLVRVYRKFAGKSFLVLSRAITSSVSAVVYVLMTLILFLFIFGLMGIRLFGDAFPDPSQRYNFNSMWEAMLTVFISSTGDSWSYTMVDAQRGSGKTWAPYVYFITMFVIGNYCLLNLVAAVIVDGFAAASEAEADDDPPPDADSSPQVRGGELNQIIHTAPRPDTGNVLRMDLYTGEDEIKPSENKSRLMLQIDRAREEDLRLIVLQVVLNSWQFTAARCTVIVVFDIVFLAFERPTMEEEPGPGSLNQTVLDKAHTAATVATGVEVMLRVLAFGIGSWTLRTDILLLFVGYIAGIFYRPIRAARPLRYVHVFLTSSSRRILVESLGQALRGLAQVTVVCFFIWLLFSVLGMQLFMGRLFFCSDSAVATRLECNGTFNVSTKGHDGEYLSENNRTWHNQEYGFDNLGMAMWTLFQIATGDGWSSVMFSAVDSRGEDDDGNLYNPAVDANPHYLFFFCIFMLVGGVFAINLFVGVLFSEFAAAKEAKQSQRMSGLTQEEATWVKMQSSVRRLKPFPQPRIPREGPRWVVAVRRRAYVVVRHPCFGWGIVAAILANVVILSAHHHGQSEAQTDFEFVAKVLFACLFAVEAALKIAGVGMTVYMRSQWNRFDFFLAVLGVLSLPLSDVPVVNMLRLLRLMRLVQRSRGMQRLFAAVAQSLQGVVDVFLLLIGVFFVFGAVGVQAFGRVLNSDGKLLDNMNFKNLRNAILTLFYSSTFVRWRNFKDGCSITPENSDCTYEEGNCGVTGAWVFFFVFVLVGGFVGLNLFVTVVFEGFGDTLQAEEAARFELLQSAVALWERFDPDARGWLSPRATHVYFKVLLDPEFGTSWAAQLGSQLPLTAVFWRVPIPVFARPVEKKTDMLKRLRKRSTLARRRRTGHDAWFQKKREMQLRVRFQDTMSALIRVLCPEISTEDTVRLKDLLPNQRVFTGQEPIFFFVHWYATTRLVGALRRNAVRKKRPPSAPPPNPDGGGGGAGRGRITFTEPGPAAADADDAAADATTAGAPAAGGDPAPAP